jgi:hypothetical protein
MWLNRHDLDHDRACIVVVEEITAVDPAGNDVVVFGGEPGPDRSSPGCRHDHELNLIEP